LRTTIRRVTTARNRSVGPLRVSRHLHVMGFLMLVALTATPALAQPGAAQRADIVIRNARVFDGVDWRDNFSIAISAGRILDVAQGAGRFRGATDIDGSRWTVIPGMIDAHVHVLDNRSAAAATPWILEQLQRLLRAGVTTIQSTSDATADIVELRRRIADGAVQAPRLRVTGAQIGAVGGPKSIRCGPGTVRCQVNEVADEAEVRNTVAQLASAGVDAVKFVVDRDHERTLSLPLVRAIVEAAHTHRLRAFGHIDNTADARAAVEFGLDALLHPVPWRAGAPDEAAAFLASRKVPVSTTLSLRAPFLRSDTLMTTPGGGRYSGSRFRLLQHGLAVARSMHRAGATIAVGTDHALVSTIPAESHYMRELQLLVEAGLSTTEVLRAATWNAARHLGAADLGRIAPGSVADVVVLTGDPRKNVLELGSVIMVVKDGRIVVDNRAP
jgi:imidazolonepropionase-like amidohydrolase